MVSRPTGYNIGLQLGLLSFFAHHASESGYASPIFLHSILWRRCKFLCKFVHVCACFCNILLYTCGRLYAKMLMPP